MLKIWHSNIVCVCLYSFFDFIVNYIKRVDDMIALEMTFTSFNVIAEIIMSWILANVWPISYTHFMHPHHLCVHCEHNECIANSITQINTEKKLEIPIATKPQNAMLWLKAFQNKLFPFCWCFHCLWHVLLCYTCYRTVASFSVSVYSVNQNET